MPACIICHLDITEGVDQKECCPGDHPVHSDCLKEWLRHSKNCPLCNNPYSQTLIAKYQSFLDQKEKEKLDAEKEQQMRDTEEKISKIAEKMVFLKFVEYIEGLAEKQEYDAALDRIAPFESDNLTEFKAQRALFLKGKMEQSMSSSNRISPV